MVALNPAYRSADEVIVPNNRLFGWTEPESGITIPQALYKETESYERLFRDMPLLAKGPDEPFIEPLLKKWNEFQKSKGRFEGSCDWSLIDEFVFGLEIVYLPQIIGSCVISNTFPGYTEVMMIQIGLRGMPQEYFGRTEFGPSSLAFYAPWSYGSARRRANMKGSDGLYCEPMLESLIKDGVVSCATPKLHEILKANNLFGDTDMPEPQGNDGAALYRRFGNWQYLDDLKSYADFPVTNGRLIRSIDEQLEVHKQGGICFVCSGIAIKKVGEHKDGFAIHDQNLADTWPHNMRFAGFFVASDGEIFIRFINQSWGKNHIYNIPYKSVSKWYSQGKITVASIERINGPKSKPPLAA